MYQVFLGAMPLPVAPGKIETTIRSRNETVDLVSGEEISILKTQGLQEIRFEFMIPTQDYPFGTMIGNAVGNLLGNYTGLVESFALLKYLEQLKTSKTPFQFIVVRLGMGSSISNFDLSRLITNVYNVNLKCTLEDYTIIEDADNGNDIMVEVRLRQYRDWSTVRIDPDTGKEQRTRPK